LDIKAAFGVFAVGVFYDENGLSKIVTRYVHTDLHLARSSAHHAVSFPT
jgi:hypothetical protein